MFITALPIFMVNETKASDTIHHVTYTELLGYGLWCLGFLFEVIADIQKTKFKISMEHGKIAKSSSGQPRTPFICHGLWSTSRHPNYFGEIVLWFGIAVIASVHVPSFRQKALCFISPVFVASLLIYVSGIPLLEVKGREKWGDNSQYEDYLKNTPVLIPFIGRRGSAPF